MRIRLLFFLLLYLILTSTGCGGGTSTTYDAQDSEQSENIDVQDQQAYSLTDAMNLNCKYILKEWWSSPKDTAYSSSYLPNKQELTEEQKIEIMKSVSSFSNWKNDEYLIIPNWKRNNYSENAILPSCYACRIVSTALYHGVYDKQKVGVSKDDARAMICKLIASLAKYHCSNSENGWGNCWQGALWAEILGMSAYFMRDNLSDKDWNYVCNMVASECKYVVDVAGVKVYKDRGGYIREGREGDSQSETDAWNATILALAQLIIPQDEMEDKYGLSNATLNYRLIELCITAMTRPSDVYSKEKIDGYDFINCYGSNINEDGTVTNHNKIHIDYMASPIESFSECYIAFSLANKHIIDSLGFNVDTVYNALVSLDLGKYDSGKAGHHFYERTPEGKVSCNTNMPDENEWGNFRQANYFLVDTYVDIIAADADIPEELKANKWASERLKEILRMINRDNTGKIYRDGEENFASGQNYAMDCLSQVFTLRRIANDIEHRRNSLSQFVELSIAKLKYFMPTIISSYPNCSQNGYGYSLCENRIWTSAFYIGERYLAYEATNDRIFLQYIDTYLNSFENRLVNKINLDHDVGFLYTLSCINLYNITGNERAKYLAIQAADNLCKRFIVRKPDQGGGYIQAWESISGERPYRYMIIDTMMNIPLLYWATYVTGDTKYADIANTHAETTINNLIRDDYSVIHRCLIDSKTGNVHVWEKGAAYSDDSTWARGQAWAVYGFSLAYKYTKNEKFLETAINLANYYITHLPSNFIPYWDLFFTDKNPDIKDTSAASVLACALIELEECCKTCTKYYNSLAFRIVENLCNTYFIKKDDVLWLLNGATYTRDQGNLCSVWGDYFFLEALLKLCDLDISAEI